MTQRHFAAVWRLYTEQEERAERRTAMQILQIANAIRDTKEHPAPFTLEDFMGHNGSVSRSRSPGPRNTTEELGYMQSMFEAIAERNRAMSDGNPDCELKGYFTPRVRNEAMSGS